MEHFLEFENEPNQNWFKVIVALHCLQKPLAPFIDEQIGIFHRKLCGDCGEKPCVNNCNFNNWKPQQNQSPPLDCEVCSTWRDSILANHTSPRGKVMWMNSKPDRWSQDKWEVAKVYMPSGHEDHNSIEDFDIAALLCLMNQCGHFKTFELGGLCGKVSNVRNDIMHTPKYQLKREDLLDYFNRIRKLGEALEKHVPEFKSLSTDIDEIQNRDYKLIFPDDMTAQKMQARDEKHLEDILFDCVRTMSSTDKAKFVDDNKATLIKSVTMVMAITDELGDMVHPEAYSLIDATLTSQKQMRALYEKALRSGGEEVKAAFYDALKKHHPTLV